MYAALNKALVIDPSGELRDFLRFCAGRLWPELEIVSYRWARGCPDETFDWKGFDLVVLEERLHVPGDRGVNWLRTLRRNSAVPSIVLVAHELTEKLRGEAERAGAAGVLNKDDLSPRRFAECVDRALRGPVEEAASTAAAAIAPVEVAAAQVPGFKILRPIAATSRGWVSLATQESDQRTVALKTTRMTGEPGSSTLRRFTREYTVLSQLADANVIRVFRHGFAQNCGFVASEYCQGGHLGQRIERGIPVSNALDYLAQIMRGLGAVHAHGILHRDIKPTNLLFREEGTLVLTDLATERELSDNPRLATRSLLADLNYVSPESIRPGTVDLRSDLYSAGVVLYHMLTKTTPFGGATVAAMLEAHLSAPIPRLPSSCAALQPLVDGLLAKDPNERFQSAADVLDGINWLCLASD
jgi:DNA-binding NarL/FixJ family response regulator